ncbi:MAG: hypothetical protein GY898_04560 [Proteobacteria bacterium]|nr:hypothetical protein [Pseudomonadota bacterium]
METGYTGWGFYLISAVLGFNLMCIPLWFLVGNLRRTHEFGLKQLETFLHLLEKERSKNRHKDVRYDPELVWLIDEIKAQSEKALGLGPLWGRKHTSMAQMSMHIISERYPELAEGVNDAMQRS